MQPFIKLEEPILKNLPTKEEAKRFEDYMRARVTLSNSYNSNFNGSGYFLHDDPDDLALVFEKALDKWCKANRTISMRDTVEVTTDADGNVINEDYVDVELLSDACKDLERHVKDVLSRTVKEHLERTGGKIGHFPYSGERTLLAFKDDDTGRIYTVKLDPFKLDWTGVNIGALIETAEANGSAKSSSAGYSSVPSGSYRIEKSSRKKKKKKDPIKRRATVLAVSLAIFIVTFLGALIINALPQEPDLLFLMAVSQVISTSLTVAFVSLIMLIKAVIDKKQRYKNYYYDPFVNDGFRTQIVKTGFGMYSDFQSYNKDRFESEVKEMHKYYRFMQLWSDTSGRSHNWIKGNDFYEKIAPFVVNGKDYIL